jgi:hypothetical protein
MLCAVVLVSTLGAASCSVVAAIRPKSEPSDDFEPLLYTGEIQFLAIGLALGWAIVVALALIQLRRE